MKPRARKLLLCALLLGPGLVDLKAAEAEGWRFCVGVSQLTRETAITDVFASDAEGARLERELASVYARKTGSRLTFQCPRNNGDKVSAGMRKLRRLSSTANWAIASIACH